MDTENWPFEAEWTENGALCGTALRGLGLVYRNGTNVPPCMPLPVPPAYTGNCGDSTRWSYGALFMTDYDPNQPSSEWLWVVRAELTERRPLPLRAFSASLRRLG